MKTSVGPCRLFVLLLCFCVPLTSVLADEWHFPDVKRIVAVSDVHGAYDALVATLQNASILDDNLAWNGAETHFVITGDLLDRGPASRRVMDLVMRLEGEAARAGGRVHQLLGNHEVMNLIGDLRYVADAEYAAFSDDESAQERERWYRRFRGSQPADADESVVRSDFDSKAPPGFFGHRRAFRHDGAYGKWLLDKPLMVVINDTVFVHGGVPPFTEKYGLAGANVTLKKDLSDYVRTLASLVDKGMLSPIDRFRDRPWALLTEPEAGQSDDAPASLAKLIVDLGNSPLHRPEGPLWYRGTATCNGLTGGDALDAALRRVGASRVVIGHTGTVTRRVQQRINGRVIEIDTGMLKSHYKGSGNALIIEDSGAVSVVNENGATDLSPIAHPRRVGYRPKTIDVDALTGILTSGTIADSKPDDAGRTLVNVTADGVTVSASFSPLPQQTGFVPELAAYRLDRMLQLDMVPVTVRREMDGKQGALQFVSAELLTEQARIADGKMRNTPCPLQGQLSAMHVFDALIHNPERTSRSMLYSPEKWQLMLVHHQNSFGADSDLPTFPDNVESTIGDHWRTALLGIGDEELRASLGDVLDERSLAALVKRRDALIELAQRRHDTPGDNAL